MSPSFSRHSLCAFASFFFIGRKKNSYLSTGKVEDVCSLFQSLHVQREMGNINQRENTKRIEFSFNKKLLGIDLLCCGLHQVLISGPNNFVNSLG